VGTKGGEKRTGKRQGVMDGKSKLKVTASRHGTEKATEERKGNRNGNGKRNQTGIFTQAPVGEGWQSGGKTIGSQENKTQRAK
jgi:hypothetical protein